MGKAFAYVVTTTGPDYMQKDMRSVPCWCKRDGVMYFGPCKEGMRPRIRAGDYVFGISHSKTPHRRILFIMPVAETITFDQAYKRYPHLRGPKGPIHVVKRRARGSYRFIPGSLHQARWRQDVTPACRDIFLVGETAGEMGIGTGFWLGQKGPRLTSRILIVLRKMSVWDQNGKLRQKVNDHATICKPICNGERCRGLHAEGNDRIRQELLEACQAELVTLVCRPARSWRKRHVASCPRSDPCRTSGNSSSRRAVCR